MKVPDRKGRVSQTEKLGADVLTFLGYDPEMEWCEMWLGIRGPDLEDARLIERMFEGEIK